MVHSTWDACVWLCTWLWLSHSVTVGRERVSIPRKPAASCMAFSDLSLRVRECHLSYVLLASQLRVKEMGHRYTSKD